jgi:hypothetical protein
MQKQYSMPWSGARLAILATAEVSMSSARELKAIVKALFNKPVKILSGQ